MAFLKEFFHFIAVRRKYWMIPIFVVTVLVAVLIISSQTSVVAPFIYAVF